MTGTLQHPAHQEHDRAPLVPFIGYFLWLGTVGFGGPIALVRQGDRIRLDLRTRSLDLLVEGPELERRRTVLAPPAPRYTSGALAKYAKLVGSAATGAVTG